MKRQRLLQHLVPLRVQFERRIETTQVYTQLQPAPLKESVKFYEARALEELTTWRRRKMALRVSVSLRSFWNTEL